MRSNPQLYRHCERHTSVIPTRVYTICISQSCWKVESNTASDGKQAFEFISLDTRSCRALNLSPISPLRPEQRRLSFAKSPRLLPRSELNTCPPNPGVRYGFLAKISIITAEKYSWRSFLRLHCICAALIDICSPTTSVYLNSVWFTSHVLRRDALRATGPKSSLAVRLTRDEPEKSDSD